MLQQRTNSLHPKYKELVALLDQELSHRFGAIQKSYDVYNVFEETVDVFLICDEEQAVACGVIRPLEGTNSAELKRMFVHKDYRGQGWSKVLVQALETWAIEQGFEAMILETGDKLVEAISLYKSLNYSIIENYGPYIHLPNSICMKKNLTQ